MTQEKQTSVPLSDRRTAGYAELFISPAYTRTRNKAFEAAEGDGELYASWNESSRQFLGKLAVLATRSKRDQLPADIWELQREVTLSLLDEQSPGPFAEYFFSVTSSRQKAEVEPSDGDISHLPPGERDVVQTNSQIMTLRDQIDDSSDFFKQGLTYVRSRRSVGFVGPENYATLLKFAADKVYTTPLEEKEAAGFKTLVNECLGGFMRIAERDAPNIVEVTSILSAIKSLPKGMVDERYTAGVLRETLRVLPDFTQDGLNLLMGAVAKLDVSKEGEAAAYTIDMALRKGNKFERSGDFRTALRAVSVLPKAPASERAFSTLLDVRNNLEVATDLEGLDEISARLRHIVENVTENQKDSQRVKGLGEFIFKQATLKYRIKMNEGGLTPKAEKSYGEMIRRIRHNTSVI